MSATWCVILAALLTTAGAEKSATPSIHHVVRGAHGGVRALFFSGGDPQDSPVVGAREVLQQHARLLDIDRLQLRQSPTRRSSRITVFERFLDGKMLLGGDVVVGSDALGRVLSVQLSELPRQQ